GYRIKVCPAAEVHHKYAESHLRTATRVPKSLYYPVRSKTYFALKHRRNDQPLDEVFAYLREHARRLRHDHQWLIDSGLIDHAGYARLLDDIQRGAADGVHDAFARLDGLAARNSRPTSASTPYVPFPVLRPARER